MTQKLEARGGAAAWRRDDFRGDGWIDVLTAEERTELAAAAASLPKDYDQWLSASRDDVPLPVLASRLARINAALETGHGFGLIRGTPLSPDDVDGARRVNWVLALHLGNVIAQNANGEVMGEVKAEVTGEITADTRGYVSNAELRFHCDGGDVASLLCVRQAPAGGANHLVSAVSVHDAMVKECPQHLETLYRGMPMYMRRESMGDEQLESSRLPRQPLFIPHEEGFLCWSNLRLMELSYDAAGHEMPADERAALDAFEAIAERAELKLEVRLQPGDMLLTYNYTCMHKRQAFVDDDDPARARLMLRLWYNLRDGVPDRILPAAQRKGYFTQNPYVIVAETTTASAEALT